ncbi:MAG: hypothetical protein COU47_03705 [Candidatus Niyogibacteria bacterium CG10_big_fil_rev_8_21_14_0_10_46_36]|uniref:Recombinase zinc beta ribbon domain-containing protein n=1 Tax=Candidatus Niyogibacteria bacterium CG10_big_fil_rev_8_21_14_0_10_46_36 TaxID=1974726 RepID=A0A2H0TCB0_9BACT|nr:MAG: hypothetical protein COU47_03705 [Candidatus Niyogibacteria bacterium CG10_big_fil_rev_8_21_14_0_10_46_36]
MFDAVQNNLKERYVTRTEGKEFAFTQIMRCGLCGSGVTADEKFKKLKDGSVNRHVYYMCTKSRDINCKNRYINESDLIKEMSRILDVIHLDELGLRDRIDAELKRYNRFRTGVLGAKKKKESVSELDIRNYAKYLLQEGTIMEKREILMHLRSRLVLENKKLSLG